MDNWAGTNGDDIVQAQNATLNTFDHIDGGAGQDTMTFVATNDVSVPVGATIKNIETINVLNSGNHNINAAGFVGAQEVWQVSGAGNIAGLANGATAGFRDVVFAGGEQPVQQITDVLYDAADVTLGDMITVTVNGTSFSAQVVDWGETAGRNIVAQINAANIGVTADYRAVDQGVIRLTGTDGEEFTASGTQNANDLSTNDVQEAGTEIVDGRNYDVAFAGESGNIVFDNVDFGESAIAIKGTKVTTVTISGEIEAGDLKLDGTNAAVKTLNLDFDTAVQIDHASMGTFTSLVTFDASASTGTIRGFIHGEALETILTGSGDDSIGLAGGETNLEINLGAGNDRLTASASNSGNTITLGEGNDVVIFNSAAGVDGYLRNVLETDAELLEEAFMSEIVSISDFNGAEDVLNFTGTANGQSTLNGEGYVLNNQEVANVAAADSLFDALGLVATAAGVNEWTTFQYGGNTYIFQNDNTEGFNGGPGGAIDARGDGVIELVGFTGTLDATNFVVGSEVQ